MSPNAESSSETQKPIGTVTSGQTAKPSSTTSDGVTSTPQADTPPRSAPSADGVQKDDSASTTSDGVTSTPQAATPPLSASSADGVQKDDSASTTSDGVTSTPQAATPPRSAPSADGVQKDDSATVDTTTAEQDAQDDSFWKESSKKHFAQNYTDEQVASMSKDYEATLNEVREKEVVTGLITRLTDKHVVISIGYKSDGLIHRTEFRDIKEELKVGEEVEVFIERQEDKGGNLIISRRKARMIRIWERIQTAYEQENAMEGRVKRRTKGGLILDLLGIEAFLPGSQVDVKPVKDFDAYVGKTIEVKVVKINHVNDNVVVSHKMLIEKSIEAQKVEILKNLEKGQVLEGLVKNITSFGVFVDLGGMDGLLHITDISWGRINSPKDVLEVGQKINVVVLSFDDKKKRISLGLKQLQAHPWDITKEYEKDQKVKGKIVNITDYGAFLEISPGVEGLIHVSEMSWSQHLCSPEEFVKLGDEVEAIILSIDHEEYKMALGLKQLREDPWKQQDLLTKYGPGTRHEGLVRNLTNYGLFLELEEGIDGLVHVSDLSWVKKIKHPTDFIKTGEKLKVYVLDIDPENKRLSLSHKHLEKNPWDEFESTFGPGTTHECTIMQRNEKVAFLELPYGLDGVCFINNLQKEDGNGAIDGEALTFVVTEFSKDEKRILLSHTHTFKQPAKFKGSGRTKGRRDNEAVQQTLQEVNRNTTKTTMGDLESLSSLREQMESAAPAEETENSKKDDKKDDKKDG